MSLINEFHVPVNARLRESNVLDGYLYGEFINFDEYLDAYKALDDYVKEHGKDFLDVENFQRSLRDCMEWFFSCELGKFNYMVPCITPIFLAGSFGLQ